MECGSHAPAFRTQRVAHARISVKGRARAQLARSPIGMAARTIADVGEFAVLSRLLSRLRNGRGTIVGPGQDCAVIECGGRWLFTIDALVDGVHFESGWLAPRQIGRKSVLINVSDIAAMGGQPRFCVVNIGAPASYLARDLDDLQSGIVSAAAQCGASVVGGNLTRADRLSVSIALLGAAPRRLVTRQGARPGDRIYVTGTLGDAALAVQYWQARRTAKLAAHAVRRFREPSPRLQAGRFLVESGIASAMIDVSDGLLQDLGHLCDQSRAGAIIRTDHVPLSRAYRSVLGADSRLALQGGEDYELLCTVPERHVKQLERQQARLACPITCIGEITAGRRMRLRDQNGPVISADVSGFDHFRRRD